MCLLGFASVFTGSSSCMNFFSNVCVRLRDFFLFFCFHRLEMCLQSPSHMITSEIITSRLTRTGPDFNSWKGSSRSLEYGATACQRLLSNSENNSVRVCSLFKFQATQDDGS